MKKLYNFFTSKIFYSFVYLFFIVGTIFFVRERTASFSINKIVSSSSNPAWEMPEISQEQKNSVMSILSQKFIYLNKGRQCFVFESEDKQYVIKFFNKDSFSMPFFLDRISLFSFFEKMRLRKVLKKSGRKEFYFNSYKLAFEELKHESALLYVHLNESSDLQKDIVIKDKASRIYVLDLDKVAFVLQRKSELLFSVLDQCIQEKKEYKIKNVLDSFLHVISVRCQKCLEDDDVDVSINFGYIDDRAIAFDTGRLLRNENLNNAKCFEYEIKKSTKCLRSYLQKTYPDVVGYFDEKVQELSCHPDEQKIQR